MITNLKNSFMQAAFGSLVWIGILMTLFSYQSQIPFYFIWNLILISTLLGLVFGVLYPYLWNYSTFPAWINIILSTIANFTCMLSGVYLYSTVMFHLIAPYFIGMLVLTLIGHILGFYFYSKYKNKKTAAKLNQLTHR